MKKKNYIIKWIKNVYLFLTATVLFIFSPVVGQAPIDGLKSNNSLAVAINGAVPFLIEKSTGDYPEELNRQFDALDLGDLSMVSTDITLPITMGTAGVIVSWTSSNPSIIGTNGKVTLPQDYDTPVKLTATLIYTLDGITYTRIKEFDAYVIACNCDPLLIAKWDFACENVSFENGTIKVKDISGNELVGTLKNGAQIRTYGTSRKFYVLDLGSNNGYFDMGTEIGSSIYNLTNYTIGAYFFIDPSYNDLNLWGNCLWRFSNSENLGLTSDGAMYMSLKNQGNIITPSNYTAESGPKLNTNAVKGAWKHIAYTQDGDTGRIFLDGIEQIAVKVDLTPSEALIKIGQTGTKYNTIGYPAYSGDSFLKKTLVYGFEIYSITLLESDLLDDFGLDVDETVEALNRAFGENPNLPDQVREQLNNESENFTLSKDTIAENINLPVKGVLDTTIVIQWSSNRPDLLLPTGIVNRPDYCDMPVVLTVYFIKDCQMLLNSFNVTVLANPETVIMSDLLLHYDFIPANTQGNTVTDVAEKHFTGTLMKGAFISNLIGCTGVSGNALYLPSDSAYFDMGTECGKLIYGLKDYSICAFFFIESGKTNFNNNGNFIYTFANSTNALADKNGYMFGRATNLYHTVSSEYWYSGNQTTPNATQPELGLFHHFVYTQKGNVGTVYFDGDSVTSNSVFSNLPSKAVVVPGRTGTLYNFLGKSCYAGDAGLGQAMIADFRLYNRPLTKLEVRDLFEDKYPFFMQTLTTCDITTPQNSPNQLKVDTSIPGLIQILDLKGNENVAIYDVMGHKIPVNNINAIAVRSGMYIVRVDNKVVKVLVK